MLKMSAQLENIISAYRTLAKIPSVAGAKLNNAATKVNAKWSVRNLDKGKVSKFASSYSLDYDFNVIDESDFGTDISNEILSAVSPNETYRALIREEKTGKDPKKLFLEVWSKKTLAHSVDLTSLDKHGDVYADSEFGGLQWSSDETALVYVAEKKLPKFEPYIKRKDDKPKADGSGETAPKRGEEFLYRQDWGEQLGGKHLSVVVIFKLDGEKLIVLDGIPESMCPGQVRFSPDGNSVVGVVWETEPRRLGLIFCTNRPSYIFECTLEGDFRKITADGLAVRSPRFSPTGDLVWLQRKADGPHHACHELAIRKKGIDVPTKLIDIVGTSVNIQYGDVPEPFYGIYCQALPGRCFNASGNMLLFSTPQETEVRSYVFNFESRQLVDISNRIQRCSTTILDVKGDVVLATCSNMKTPGQLYVARLPPTFREHQIVWKRVSSNCEAPFSVIESDVVYFELGEKPKENFTAIYFTPRVKDKKLPLIVWPHGGPHSNFVNAFSFEAAMFNMLGFACLQVNYRGSTGAGELSLKSLLGRCGDKDVKNCKEATDYTVENYPIDSRKVCLMGGSHGGFLVTHLSGQYPDTYAVVVTRNPVTDIASFASVRINYRGSIGHGDDNARSLISHVGEYDVQDCYLALNTALERDGGLCRNNLFLYGGSYGGLIVAHLAGIYPDEFRAMVMRNPLIDLATKGYYADNSDGCAVEAGYEFTEKGPVTEEMLLAMRRASPLVHVHKVKAPTALMLGSGDQRVPYYQGLEYARRLKANGVPTRIYMYEDNHSLSSPAAEMDNLINGLDWFMQHLEESRKNIDL